MNSVQNADRAASCPRARMQGGNGALLMAQEGKEARAQALLYYLPLNLT